MTLSKEDFLAESLAYSLYNYDFIVLPSVHTSEMQKYLCVTDRFYIIAERGETGFETSLHYFSGEIKAEGEEITINIRSVDDKTITNSIYDNHLENTYSCADVFNEHIIDFSGRRTYNDFSRKQLDLFERIDFIHLPYKGNQRKIAVQVDYEGELSFERFNGYKHLDTNNDAYHNTGIGALLYRRDSDIHNMLEIVKLQQFAKDFHGNFWGVAEIVYVFPADAEKIKTEYPDFYSRECLSDITLKKQNLLKTAKELPYIREDYNIGDGIIYIPVEMTASEISIPVGTFHFISDTERCYGHLTRREKGRLRLNDMPVICSLIEVDRRFKLIYYRAAGFVKFGETYYAELRFFRQSNFFDKLDTDEIYCHDLDYDSHMTDKRALNCAIYLMFRNIIKPIVINNDLLGSNISEE